VPVVPVAVASPALRILIAEDDVSVARHYRTYALRRGHQVVVARDGAEALLLAAAEMPDVVLLDVLMPKLDGRDVLRQLKASAATAGIPVVVLSGLGGDQNLRDQLVDLGVEDVLEKPLDLAVAFAKIERVVARHRAFRPEGA
jgi:DNA-binding response OmpR family regulator